MVLGSKGYYFKACRWLSHPKPSLFDKKTTRCLQGWAPERQVMNGVIGSQEVGSWNQLHMCKTILWVWIHLRSHSGMFREFGGTYDDKNFTSFWETLGFFWSKWRPLPKKQEFSKSMEIWIDFMEFGWFLDLWCDIAVLRCRFFQVIIVVLVLYFAIRAAIHASEWLCAPSATRKARRLMLRAATAKEYKARTWRSFKVKKAEVFRFLWRNPQNYGIV